MGSGPSAGGMIYWCRLIQNAHLLPPAPVELSVIDIKLWINNYFSPTELSQYEINLLSMALNVLKFRLYQARLFWHLPLGEGKKVFVLCICRDTLHTLHRQRSRSLKCLASALVWVSWVFLHSLANRVLAKFASFHPPNSFHYNSYVSNMFTPQTGEPISDHESSYIVRVILQ